MRKRNSLSLFPRPALPPSIARWLTEEWFTAHYAPSLGGELLLPINFVIHLQWACSVHTNRIQNSRCFIMLLQCVLTNAAGCLPWLPQCRLLPGLESTACPATGGTPLAKKQKCLFVCSVNFIWSAWVFTGWKIGIVPVRINCNANTHQQICQAGLCINVIMMLNGFNNSAAQSQSSVRNQFSSQGSCHAASAIPR